MKRCLTLGISLCLVGLLSGCCCGQRFGANRCGSGCSTGYAPACSPCGQSFGGFAPMGGGGCNSCGQGGAQGYGAPGYGAPGYGGIPTGYIPSDGYSTAAVNNGVMPGSVYPQADALSATAYGQPAQFGQPAAPITTALMKPDSLATY